MYYNFKNNSGIDRFSSYFYQLRELLNRKPESILEIGVGDRVISSYIQNNTEIKYTSLDYNKTLKPDIGASIESNLREMLRLSKKHVIASTYYYFLLLRNKDIFNKD